MSVYVAPRPRTMTTRRTDEAYQRRHSIALWCSHQGPPPLHWCSINDRLPCAVFTSLLSLLTRLQQNMFLSSLLSGYCGNDIEIGWSVNSLRLAALSMVRPAICCLHRYPAFCCQFRSAISRTPYTMTLSNELSLPPRLRQRPLLYYISPTHTHQLTQPNVLLQELFFHLRGAWCTTH